MGLWFALAVLGLCLLGWGMVLRGALMLARVPRLRNVSTPEPIRWPRLSVIVPACNEDVALESAARSLLGQDYPDLEVVLVDDRSTDRTGEIVRRLGNEDPRVIPVQVADLPDGWLGKVHALHTGLGFATGQWILFTDADVHFAPGALRRAVAFAEARQLDHLTAIPAAWSVGLIVDSLVAAFLRAFLTVVKPAWGMGRSGSRRYFGVGAFNLVRRRAFDRTPGFEWLRMETADDMGLGLMMRRAGGRCLAVTAFEDVGLWWHRTVGDAARGMEKGFAALGHCRIWRLSVMAAAGFVFDTSPVWAPVLALLPLPWPVRMLGSTVAVVFVTGSVLFARWARVSSLPVLITPLLAPLVTAMIVRAAWLGWRRGGIGWRGTEYPCTALRAGIRVKLP